MKLLGEGFLALALDGRGEAGEGSGLKPRQGSQLLALEQGFEQGAGFVEVAKVLQGFRLVDQAGQFGLGGPHLAGQPHRLLPGVEGVNEPARLETQASLGVERLGAAAQEGRARGNDGVFQQSQAGSQAALGFNRLALLLQGKGEVAEHPGLLQRVAAAAIKVGGLAPELGGEGGITRSVGLTGAQIHIGAGVRGGGLSRLRQRAGPAGLKPRGKPGWR
jgi:hypothetical protein